MVSVWEWVFFQQVLGRVDALRKKIVSIGKEHASLCAKVGRINSELNANYITSTMLQSVDALNEFHVPPYESQMQLVACKVV